MRPEDPRLINILAHKALLLSFGEGATRVQTSHVKAAIQDTEDASVRRLLSWKWLPFSL